MDQKDSDIKRNRLARLLIAMASLTLALIFSVYAGLIAAHLFFLPNVLGWSAGMGLSVLVIQWLIPRLCVKNRAVHAFVTVDLLNKELVSYGPGFHFSFPWEARDGANNVSLKETEEKFEFTVQTATGTLKGHGSFRLRPDITRLPAFLAGVAALAAELSDIVAAESVQYLTDKPVMKAIKDIGKLNGHLKETFTARIAAFEERFGVCVGDVTVASLLPSTEVQKAIDGQAESAALEKIIARSLGYRSMAAVHKAIQAHKLTSDQVAHATENAMAMTDNLHNGMKINRDSYTVHLRADSEVADAIKAAGPAIGAGLSLLTKPKRAPRKRAARSN